MRKFLRERVEKNLAHGLIILSIIGAIFLAVVVELRPILFTDIRISTEIQEPRIIPLLPIMEAVSVFGNPPVTLLITVLTAIFFYLASYRREAIFALLTFIADGLNGLIKLMIHRPRPSDTVITVYQKFTDSSFPSGHVVHYVVFFGFLIVAMVMLKKLPPLTRALVGSASIILIIMISLSRIYLGAHWATDVIGGYFVGYLMLNGLLYFYFDKEFLRALPEA